MWVPSEKKPNYVCIRRNIHGCKYALFAIFLLRNRQLRVMGDVGQHKIEENRNIKIKTRLIA